MTKQMRCAHKLHGIVLDPGVVEIKCNSAFCGYRPGVVVLHRFSADDGHLIETKRYKDTPMINGKEEVVRQDGDGHRIAVWNP